MRHILSNVSAIDRDKIFSGKWDEQEWEKMRETTDAISHYPIYIDDEPLWVIENFCDRVKQDVEATKAKVIFIDYLQLISSRLPSQNRYEEVVRCTRELKRLARELDLPVIVASLLDRIVGKRLFEFSCERHLQTDDLCDERLLKMDELRGSETFSSICEEADVVLLLHRPEYYLRRGEDENGNDIRGLAEVYIAKNHMGRQGMVKLKFTPETYRFDNWR